MRAWVIAAILIAVIASAGTGYLFGVSHQGGSNSTSTISTKSSINGLQLTASINVTTIKPGQRLGIAVSLYNTIPSLLNVSTSNAWKVDGFPIAMWPECYGYPPVEFMLIKGNYSLSAFEAASGNESTEVVPRMEPFVSCGGGFGGDIDQFIFQPTSSIANLSGVPCINIFPCVPKSLGAYDLTSNFTVDGYWAYHFNYSEAWDILNPNKPCVPPQGCTPGSSFQFPEVGPIAQHLFTSGLYTLIVDDEWGQAVILHFSDT